MAGTPDKLRRIRQLSELGYNTPRIMLIPCRTVIEDNVRNEMLELARGDQLMTVRTYHPHDEIRYPEGPFAPEKSLEEALTLAQQFVKEWNVLWQEAIDINETLITG